MTNIRVYRGDRLQAELVEVLDSITNWRVPEMLPAEGNALGSVYYL
jgi:hypothetical protein